MILIAGDTHGDQRRLGLTVAALRPDALVHVGDIELQTSSEKHLIDPLDTTHFYWVPGNHDFDSPEFYDRLHSDAFRKGALHGRVVNIDGLRFAGLGGCFGQRSWYPPAPPVDDPSGEDDGKQLIKYDPSNLGRIWILDPRANVYVAADCTLPEYAEGMTQHRHKINLAWARENAKGSFAAEALLMANREIDQMISRMTVSDAERLRRALARVLPDKAAAEPEPQQEDDAEREMREEYEAIARDAKAKAGGEGDDQPAGQAGPKKAARQRKPKSIPSVDPPHGQQQGEEQDSIADRVKKWFATEGDDNA